MMIEDNFAEVVESVKAQIEYENLIESERVAPDFLNTVVDLIADVYLSTAKETVITCEVRPMRDVKNRFSQLTSEHMLTSEHIEYVFDCLSKTQTKVKNIRQYLRAALFNAPATMGAYYERLVHENHGY